MIIEIKDKWETHTINTDEIKTVSPVRCDADWGTNGGTNWRWVYTYFRIHTKDGKFITISIENGWNAYFDSLPSHKRDVNDGGLMWIGFQKTESCNKSIEEAESKRLKVLELWGGKVVAI